MVIRLHGRGFESLFGTFERNKQKDVKKITKRHQIKNVNTMFAVLCNVEVKEVFNNTQMFASGFDSSRSKKIIRLCVVKKCFCFL